MIKYPGVEFTNSSNQWEAGPAGPTNKKQENVDQIKAKHLECSEVRFRKKYKIFFPEGGASEI
jgi:hypothetical protein